MLERLEDIKDLKMLVETRKTPLKFRSLGDVLKEYSPGVWVYIERRAERDLKKLSAEDFHRIITHIKGLAEKPRPPSVASWLVQKNEWRQRVGSYRVIYEIDDKEKIIRIMRVRHRCEVSSKSEKIFLIFPWPHKRAVIGKTITALK